MTLFIKHTIKIDKEKVASLLTQEFVAQIQIDLQNSFHIAAFYSYLGENGKALEFLENAIDRGFINYPLLNKHDILLKNVRKEKRFKKLMQKVKYEWENFKV